MHLQAGTEHEVPGGRKNDRLRLLARGEAGGCTCRQAQDEGCQKRGRLRLIACSAAGNASSGRQGVRPDIDAWHARQLCKQWRKPDRHLAPAGGAPAHAAQAGVQLAWSVRGNGKCRQLGQMLLTDAWPAVGEGRLSLGSGSPHFEQGLHRRRRLVPRSKQSLERSTCIRKRVYASHLHETHRGCCQLLLLLLPLLVVSTPGTPQLPARQ